MKIKTHAALSGSTYRREVELTTHHVMAADTAAIAPMGGRASEDVFWSCDTIRRTVTLSLFCYVNTIQVWE